VEAEEKASHLFAAVWFFNVPDLLQSLNFGSIELAMSHLPPLFPSGKFQFSN
jgi:hypothetical protein